jgi:RNA polymerase sigma factor (sigma-70 family)
MSFEQQPPKRDGSEEFNDDLVRIYLDEIGQYPLLDAAQEVELGKAIEAGQFAAEALSAGEDLTESQVAELTEIVRQGNEAKELFINSNLKLVVSISKRYRPVSLSQLDLIQFGNIGLMTVVEKYDWRTGFKFSTYATFYIRAFIKRGIAKTDGLICTSIMMYENAITVANSIMALNRELGRMPTSEEISARTSFSLEKLSELRRLGEEVIYLSQEPYEDAGYTYEKFLADPKTSGEIESNIDRDSAQEIVKRIIHRLNDSDTEIMEISLRNGIDDRLDYNQIAEELGVSTDLAREKVGRVGAKIRHPSMRDVTR